MDNSMGTNKCQLCDQELDQLSMEVHLATFHQNSFTTYLTARLKLALLAQRVSAFFSSVREKVKIKHWKMQKSKNKIYTEVHYFNFWCASALLDKNSSQVFKMEKNIKNNLKCEICEKGFSSKKNKRRHLNIVHTEEKRFACNVCSKTYGTKGDMGLIRLLCSS